MSNSEKVFLSAKWLHLAMLNYVIHPELLNSYLPKGTTLDFFDGKTYLSLVGFRFCGTKLFGKISLPFHTDFEELNLRFYVRRQARQEVRRGVVFIKEIVPKWAIALTARIAYGEHYISLPMTHTVVANEANTQVEYSWKSQNKWSRLMVRSTSPPALPLDSSFEQFITEHHWGYASPKPGKTLEYHVSHVPWRVSIASEARFEGNPVEIYGRELGEILLRPPDSAFIADGSSVNVYSGVEIL